MLQKRDTETCMHNSNHIIRVNKLLALRSRQAWAEKPFESPNSSILHNVSSIGLIIHARVWELSDSLYQSTIYVIHEHVCENVYKQVPAEHFTDLCFKVLFKDILLCLLSSA